MSTNDDWLTAMAHHRPHAIEQRRAGYDLSWTEYGFAKLCAMRPVSGLARADMLAQAQICLTRVEALAATLAKAVSDAAEDEG